MEMPVDYARIGGSYEDALGVIVSDNDGDHIYDFGDRFEDPEDDGPRGLSDMIGDNGYHPDRTPIDVLMGDTHLGLTVGFAMLDDDA